MARRCSLCGSWNDQTARQCEKCGERLSARRPPWRRLYKVLIVIAGGALIGANLMRVIDPLMDTRVAPSGQAIALVLAGLIALVIGLSRGSGDG